MSFEVHALFPIPVYKTTLKSLTLKEIKLIQSLNYFSQTLGNVVSENNHILEIPELFSLKTAIENEISNYVKDIIKSQLEIYITNSWVNRTTKNQQHFLHNHSNSILSGVYYINVDDSNPSITFNRMQSPFFLNFIPNEFTIFNSTEWTIPVENNTLIIFPSTMYHYVKPNETDNERVSLAFNTFVRGNIGYKNGSYLELK